jgi:hypothetical protein
MYKTKVLLAHFAGTAKPTQTMELSDQCLGELSQNPTFRALSDKPVFPPQRMETQLGFT